MGRRNLVRVRVRNIVVAAIFDFMTVTLGRVEIVTLTKGATAKEGVFGHFSSLSPPPPRSL